ncbi:MAG: ABC transporter permease [Clostridia bacterium]|nr:ABC transporter permease [Clostridia bacterium]
MITAMLKRNIKLFFKDKGMFFTSLITPIILLVLYATFLGNVYRDSFTANLPEFVTISDSLLDALVGGQLISSILSVSCITVAFSSNFLMVQDKANGSIKDLSISPVKSSVLSMSYYFATLISTLIVCLSAMAICLGYIAMVGWYMTVTDVLLLLVDVVVLVLLGTAVSSVINFFLSSQGQIAAVGSIVSSGYGFICGAYMPISTFSDGLQKVLSFFPGTYGTSLVRTHAMRGAFEELENQNIPAEVVDSIKSALDYNKSFFDKEVSVPAMYIVLGATVVVFVVAYILMNKYKKAK